tara:strand:+ start:190 stop:804 length:615 start_codon:yes stop_codon:yes gene_type:complete
MYKYFDILDKYFYEFDLKKKEKLSQLHDIYEYYNSKINLISRKDFENFYLHHVIHSLTLCKFIENKKLNILDLGTGGGFPGIPLSIFFEKNTFLLVDSISKKIKVLNQIIKKLNLNNVQTLNGRVEEVNDKQDIIVCRAVTSIPNIINWTKKCTKKGSVILLLKGGNVEKELKNIHMKNKIFKLENIYSEDFFIDKKIIKIEVD